jgi:hypothetical protein
MIWLAKHPRARKEMLGYLPQFLSDADPRPAKEQIHSNYVAGWQPFEGFTMLPNGDLAYPEDPDTRLLYASVLHPNTTRTEYIHFYEHAWLAIIQLNGTFEVARLD